jgi:hypothetical protein
VKGFFATMCETADVSGSIKDVFAVAMGFDDSSASTTPANDAVSLTVCRDRSSDAQSSVECVLMVARCVRIHSGNEAERTH